MRPTPCSTPRSWARGSRLAARGDRGGARRGVPGPRTADRMGRGRPPGGIALWLERVGDDGAAVRQRHYLHLDADGRVARHWVYTARPRTAPAAEPVPEAAEELFASLGRSPSDVTLASSGWSGNRIDRVVLADGTRADRQADRAGLRLARARHARPRPRGAPVRRRRVRAHAAGGGPGRGGRGARGRRVVGRDARRERRAARRLHPADARARTASCSAARPSCGPRSGARSCRTCRP